MIKGRENIGVVFENLIKKLVGGIGSGLAGLYNEGAIKGELFPISR